MANEATDKVLVLMVGLPRSGKSTWAMKQGAPVVNPDSIRLALHGQPFIGLAEPFVWAIAKVMVRALFLCGHDVVILDATNTTRARRDEWRSRAWSRTFMTIPTHKAICIERVSRMETSEEHKQGLVGAIERMDAAFEHVDGEEWNDEAYYAGIDRKKGSS